MWSALPCQEEMHTISMLVQVMKEELGDKGCLEEYGYEVGEVSTRHSRAFSYTATTNGGI